MDNEQLIKQLSAESRKVPDNRKLIISKAKSEGLIVDGTVEREQRRQDVGTR